jgi:thiol-disulfide isomerase/thioredoxin
MEVLAFAPPAENFDRSMRLSGIQALAFGQIRAQMRPMNRMSRLAVTIGVVLAAPVLLFAQPEVGKPAPPLHLTQLLQAPASVHADLESLRGKVVVLEFWATWCAPCVTSLPHLNSLIAQLDPAKVQFLSIDDEDPKIVQAFLQKKNMSGWIGIDGGDHPTYAAYNIQSRPTTVIVDRQGIVAALSEEPDTLTASSLMAVYETKVAASPSTAGPTASPTAAPDASGPRPIFQVILRPSAPGQKAAIVKHPPFGLDRYAIDSDLLISSAYSPLTERAVFVGPLPEGHFDLFTEFNGATEDNKNAAVRAAVNSAFHLRVVPRTITQKAMLLTVVDPAKIKQFISAGNAQNRSLRGSWNGTTMIFNETMDDFAFALETGTECPILNKTGLDGHFDIRIHFPERDLEAARAVLKSELGLDLQPGDETKSITVEEISVEHRPDTKSQP